MYLVHGVFLKENLFTIKRADEPFKGIYSLPGGRLENESPEECLKREIKEELGVEIPIGNYLGKISYQDFSVHYFAINLPDQFFQKGSVVERQNPLGHLNPQKLKLNKEEIAGIKWMGIDKFCDNLIEAGILKEGVEKLRHLLNKIND